MPSRAQAEALVGAYLLARRANDGGRGLLALLTADAPLVLAGRLVARGALDEVAYHAAHAAALARQTTDSPAFPLTGHFELADLTEEGVVWVRHEDPTHGGSLWLALGITHKHVAWSVLTDGPADWRFAQGRAQALSLFAALTAQPGRANRDGLDVAYRLRHPSAPPPLHFEPDARFACQGSADCCRYNWEITVEPEAQAMIDAIPWAELAPGLAGIQLAPDGAGARVLKSRDADCRFLDEARRCRIHTYMGTPVFSTCVAFPFRFTETPAGVAVTTSQVCGAARAGIGPPLASRESDIRGRLALSGMRPAPAQWMLAPGLPIQWPEFDALETKARDILSLDAPVVRRLFAVSRLLEAAISGAPFDHDGIVGRALAERPQDLTANEAVTASIFTGFMLDALANASPGFAPMRHFAWVGTPLQDDAGFAGLIRTLHFGKSLSIPFDLVTAHGTSVMLYIAWLALEQAHGGTIPPDLIARLGAHAMHGMLERSLVQIFEVAPFMRDEAASPASALLFLRAYGAAAPFV